MPSDLVFHKGNALALNGVSDDNGGSAVALARCGKCRRDRIEIVRVRVQHVEAESLKLLVVRGRVHNIGDLAVDLQSVEVEDKAEVVKLVVSGNIAASHT